MKTTLLVSLFVLSACGAPAVIEPDCTRDQTEADFQGFAMTGSAVDADGKLKPPAAGTKYVISTTYLRLPKGEAAQKKFRELMAPIQAALPTQEGLVGLAFASSEKCTVARTLSVWRDEAAMYKFVASKAHADAVSAVGEVSRGGSQVTHWTGVETDATWDVARTRLAAEMPGEL